ncbi:MAG: NUDIX domain-containing protein [Proteobacteria bacterium]|nr:NUDIX domain-containing protein [Pseudomonadota bacterium]
MPKMKFCPWCGSTLTAQVIDDVARTACPEPECDYVFWNNPVPIVASIVEMDGTVILIQNKGWPETWFGLVSGFLEKDETPEQGVCRELKEELDLDADAVEFIGLYPFFARNELILAYHVLASGTITMGHELAQYKEVPVGELKPWGFGTGPAVADWLIKRRGTSDY